MKQIYLLLLVLIAGCASLQSSELPTEELEEIDVKDIEDIIRDVEKTTEISEDEALFIMREDGVEVALESVERGRLGNSAFVFYKFHGRDLVGRVQDNLNWKAYFYLTKSNLVEVPFCTSQKISNTEWVSVHCIEERILDGYSADIKIIYTSRPSGDLRALSHYKIANLDDTLLFNFTKPL